MTMTKKFYISTQSYYPEKQFVNKSTRAGVNGKWITCPKCSSTCQVFHFSWSALTCQSCKQSINKSDWQIYL